jgi:hypothetical protein
MGADDPNNRQGRALLDESNFHEQRPGDTVDIDHREIPEVIPLSPGMPFFRRLL